MAASLEDDSALAHSRAAILSGAGGIMVQLPLHRLALAVCENAAKAVGLTDVVKRAIGRRDTGGVRWNERPMQDNILHVLAVGDIVKRHIDVRGKVGVEIGPGDNLAVAYHLLTAGAARMYAVEKFASILPDWSDRLCRALGGSADEEQLIHVHSLFEEFAPPAPVDFVYSHDVLEHVNPVSVFRHAFAILKPGGDFLHAVDFTGHGCFHNPRRPLDFLTCPDWLWTLLFSAMETTNRIRWSELMMIACNTGFEVVHTVVVRRADPGYLARIRPHLLPRYQGLTDDDLSVMHCELHLRKSCVEAAEAEPCARPLPH